MTLRARLTLVLMVLVAAGLIVADVATFAALRSFLVQRVDQQLRGATAPLGRALASPDLPSGQVPLPGDGDDAFVPSGTYAALYDATDQEVNHVTFSYGAGAEPVPELPSDVTSFEGGYAGVDHRLGGGRIGLPGDRRALRGRVHGRDRDPAHRGPADAPPARRRGGARHARRDRGDGGARLIDRPPGPPAARADRADGRRDRRGGPLPPRRGRRSPHRGGAPRAVRST